MKKRVWSLLLVLCLVIAICSIATPSVSALSSDDYTQWKQGDPEWNQAAAWPLAKYPKMSQAGCWVTSVAMLMRHYGVAPSSHVEEFNPWICNQALMQAGDVNSNGDMVYGTMCRAYPDFPFYAEYTYNFNTLKDRFDAGYACMVEVQNGDFRHMVAVRYVSEDTVYIMDPGRTSTTLDTYGIRYRILCFGPFSVIPDSADYTYTDEAAYLGKCPSVPFSASVKVVNQTNLKSLPCSMETSKLSKTVRPAVKGETLDVTACLLNTADNYWFETEVDGTRCYVYWEDVICTLDNLEPSVTSLRVRPSSFRISLKEGPYDVTKTKKTIIWPSSISIDGYLINRYGNVWFHTDSGLYVYSGDCRGYSFSLPTMDFPTRDILTLSGASIPENINQGGFFIVRGTVTSGETKISSLTVGVYDENGNLATGKTVSPNEISYDIRNVDSEIRFDWLAAGSYTYRISATNDTGTQTLLDVAFIVS